VIVAANHVGDFHQSVVHHHHVVVDRHATRAHDDGVTDDFMRELNFSVDDVVKTNGMLGNAQANGAGLPRCPPPLGFRGVQGAALA
jgi:hypothetical protein